MLSHVHKPKCIVLKQFCLITFYTLVALAICHFLLIHLILNDYAHCVESLVESSFLPPFFSATVIHLDKGANAFDSGKGNDVLPISPCLKICPDKS